MGDWSLPVVELVRDGSEPKATTLLLSDKGRKEASASARDLLDAGQRVLAVDPFYVGESKVIEKDYLFALLLASVGDRPLGLQASEIAAVARWARSERKAGPVPIVAEGPRTSVMALVAAGLEPEAIGGLELRGSRGSLKELIEAGTGFSASPELFCLGLLEHFDIAQLAALPRPDRSSSSSRRTGRRPSSPASRDGTPPGAWTSTRSDKCRRFSLAKVESESSNGLSWDKCHRNHDGHGSWPSDQSCGASLSRRRGVQRSTGTGRPSLSWRRCCSWATW